MTPQEAAARLDGDEYGKEGHPELFEAMQSAGLVAVFGASDDLMEFRGAIEEEISAYGGGMAYLTKTGLIENDCIEDSCAYFNREKEAAEKRGATIEALWDQEGFSFVYVTAIPHATFIIKEDGTDYCRGIVFKLADVP
jgi:hypothetical protein